MNPLSLLLKILTGPVADMVGNWQGRKEAAVNRAADWETTQALSSNDSWKDEYLTVLLTAPLILGFFPYMAPHVTAGFAAVNEAPVWYVSGLGLAFAAAFANKQFRLRQNTNGDIVLDDSP